MEDKVEDAPIIILDTDFYEDWQDWPVEERGCSSVG